MKLSREGKRFFLATGLIAVASLNTGNNLIYLIFSMMFSILVLSVMILRMNLKGLVLKVLQIQPVFANSPANIHVTISNNKRKIPSYSIRVSMPGIESAETKFPVIMPMSALSETIPVVYKKRGMYDYGDFFIESGFPFIFFLKRVLCNVDGSIIVYPELREIDNIIPEIAGEGHELSLEGFRKGDEFAMIREFRYGDDWRRIHWKASAKTEKLMVMEYAAAEPKKLTIILDNLMPRDMNAFEKAVSLAASIADSFLKEGFFVRLFTCRKVIPFGAGREHLFKILDLLAVIEGQDLSECPLSHEAETEGVVVLILNSNDSPLNKFMPVSDMVIYAATL